MNNRFRSRVGAALVALALIGLAITGLTQVGAASDVDTLKARLKTDYVDNADTTDAASYLGAQNADGSWSDVNYGDRSRATWDPNTHVKRIRTMAAAYHTVGHAHYQDAAMLAGISDGLDYWYTRNPSSDNWWWNDIGKQLQLGPIGIMMESELTSTQIDNIIGDLATGTGSWTGQNKVWFAQQIIWRGCLENSESRVSTGSTKIQETIFLTTGDGIQYDYSFDQHGAILYNAGYGHGFIRDSAYWAYMTRGTSFAFTTAKVDLLAGLLLEGDRWMVRGEMFDPSADGREISRKNQTSTGLIRACEHMAAVDTARAAEYDALKAHIEGTGPAPVSGNRHFWHNDFMTHARAGYYLSVKMDSSRTKASETINDENLKGKWLSLGVTHLARRGDEYANIAPVWDWGRLPGVTNPHNVGSAGSGQSTTFVGGASDGTYGAAAMDFDFASTQARKAWFFFDDEVVALGAGISSTSGDPVGTTLNQCFLNGDVTVDGNTVAQGTHTLNGVQWVHHDGVGYVFPTATDAHLKNQAQSGSWYSINRQYESDTVTADVFTLWLDHGVQPSGAGYAYILVPDATAAEVGGYAGALPVRTLVNTGSVQGVRHDGLGVAGVAFYAAGSVQLHSDLTVQVDQPCIVLVDESGADTQVTVANPKNQSLTVNVTLDYVSQADETLTFGLPGGNDAGSSVTLVAGVPPTPTPTPIPGTRYPLADTYVNSGTKADDNFGGAAGLVVKQGSGDYDRRTFLKFDISDVSSVNGAKLRLYNNSLWAGSTTITAYAVGDSWEESTLTYNTMPALGSSLASTLVDADGAYFEWDVTAYVQGKVGSGVVSFALYTAESKGLTFSSREGAHAPQLVIEETGATSTPTPAPTDTPVPTPTSTPDGDVWYSGADWSAVHPLGTDNTGDLTIEFDVTPLEDAIDGVVGYADTDVTIDAWSDMAMLVRMYTNGQFEARNGGSYANDAVVNYSAGVRYHVRIEASLGAATYDVWVTPEGGSATQIASGYAFRSDAPPTDDVGQVCLQSSAGANKFKVENHAVTGSSPTPTPTNTPSPTPTSTPTPTPTPDPGTNLALNALYAYSSQQTGNEAPRAVDGDTATRWSADGFPQWIELDLGADMLIERTALVAYQDRAYQFIVEAKPDGGTYATIVDRQSNTTPGTVADPITDEFTPVQARYVKLTVTGAHSYTGSWVSVLEFRVFGGSAPDPATYAPTADAFVRNGTYADDNYGGSGVLTVKDGGADYTRKSYLTFDLSGEGLSSVSDATLWLYCSELSQGSYTARAYATDDGWAEAGLTWNTMPAQGSEVASAGVTAGGQWVTWDLTSYVNGELAGDQVVSVVIYTTDANRYSHFNSKEATAYQPYLDVTP